MHTHGTFWYFDIIKIKKKSTFKVNKSSNLTPYFCESPFLPKKSFVKNPKSKMTPGETLSPKKEYFLMMNCRDYLYTAIDGRESYIQLFKVKVAKSQNLSRTSIM